MKIEIEVLLVGFFLLCCFSIFIAPVAIYVPIFWGFSISTFVFVIIRKKMEIDIRALVIILATLMFQILASYIYSKFSYQSSFAVFFKIITNYTFLVALLLMISMCDFKKFLPQLEALLILILLLSFFQVLSKVALHNLWFEPFKYTDSASAFAIGKGLTLFGNQHKNIWATKVAFIGIIYFSGVYYKVFRKKSLLNNTIMILWLFSLFYLSSRTAQAVALIFIIGLGWYSYVRKVPTYARLIVAGLFILLLWYLIPFFIEKLFRLDESIFSFAHQGHSGDGFKARLVLWMYLFDHFNEFNHLFGNGVLFLDSFFEGVFYESNIHNVFATIWIDLGVFGLLLFLFILAKLLGGGKKEGSFFFLVGLPFISGIMVQYLGYDNDIVIYFSLAAVLADVRFNYFRKQVE